MYLKAIVYTEKIKRLEQENQILRDLVEHYKSESLTDALTEIGNRRAFDIDSKRYLNIAERNNIKLFLIMIDVDNFKGINDSRGHDYGDLVLKRVANAIKDNIRGEDNCYRVGGDEFSIYAFDENIKTLVSGVCRRVAKDAGISLSMGVVECSALPQDAGKKIADSLLYASKGAGKNCISYFEGNEIKMECETTMDCIEKRGVIK